LLALDEILNGTKQQEKIRSILLFYLLTICVFSSLGQTIDFEKDLVAYYPFNGNANDESGNGNHGKNYQSTLTKDRFGQSGKAYYFSGKSYISVDTKSLAFVKTDPMSISLWVRNESTGTAHLLGMREGAKCNYQIDWTASGGLNFRGNPFNNGLNARNVIPRNKYEHLVLSYDGKECRLYINSELREVKSMILGDDANSNLLIGGSGSYAKFKGVLDDIRIYNRALNKSEVRAIYEFDSHSIESKPQITIHPEDQEIIEGENVTFKVTVTGTGPLSFQWKKDGVDIPNAIRPELVITGAKTSDEGEYYVVVKNVNGKVTSNISLLKIVTDGISGRRVVGKFETNWDDQEEPEETYMSGAAKIGTDKDGENPSLHITDAAYYQNGGFTIEDFSNGAVFTDFELSFRLHMSDSTCCGSGDDTTAAHRPADGLSINIGNDLPDTIALAEELFGAEEGTGAGIRICFDTWDSGGGEAPAIDVWRGTEGLVRQKFNGVTSASEDEKFKDENGDYVWMWTEGEWVDVKISIMEGKLKINYKGHDVIKHDLPAAWEPLVGPSWLFAARTGGANSTHWIDDLSITLYGSTEPGEPMANKFPQITIHPEDQEIREGKDVTFKVTATGTEPLEFQWKKNRVNIPGATNDQYSIDSTEVSDQGEYYVVIKNEHGEINSNICRLTINNIPIPEASLKYKLFIGGRTFSSPAMDSNGNIFIGTGMLRITRYIDYLFSKDSNGDNILTRNESTEVNDLLIWDGDLLDRNNDGALSLEEAKSHYGDYGLTSYIGTIASIVGNTGTINWSISATPVVSTTPTLDGNGKVYIASADYSYSLNASSGTQYWENGLLGNSYSSISSSFRSSFALGKNGKLYGIAGEAAVLSTLDPDDFRFNCITVDTKTGEINDLASTSALSFNWNEEKPGWVLDSTPALSFNNILYFGSIDSRIYAVDGNSGDILWTYKTGGNVSSSPALDYEGALYIGSSDHSIYSINVTNGEKIWSYKTNGEVNSSPAIGPKGSVYIGSYDGHLYSINSKNGELNWKTTLSGPVASSPVVGDDGTVYVGSYAEETLILNRITDISERTITGKIFAIHGESGKIIWEFKTNELVISSPLIKNGVLYVCSSDGFFYALSCSSKAPANSPWPMFGQNNQRTFRSPNSPQAKLSIITQPSDQQIGEGGNIMFKVLAVGGSALTYQWKKDGIDIPNANNPELLIKGATKSNEGEYYAVVKDQFSEIISNKVFLKINSKLPLILSQPESVVTQLGGNIVFEISISGAPPFKYQWKKDGVTIPFETKAELNIVNTSNNHSGEYSVIVSNDYGRVTSDNALLTLAGKFKWVFEPKDIITGYPSIGKDDTVYIGSWDKNLYALDSKNGKVKWKFNATSQITENSPMITESGNLYITGGNDDIYCINAFSGKANWSLKTKFFFPFFRAGRDKIYVNSHRGGLYIHNDNNDESEFNTIDLSYQYKVLAIENNNTIYGFSDRLDGQHEIIKQNTKDSDVRWSFKFIDPPNSNYYPHMVYGALSNDGFFYFNGPEKYYALDSETGRLKWSYQHAENGMPSAPPVIGLDKIIYISWNSNNRETIIALNSKGSKLWEFTLAVVNMRNNHISPTIGLDGVVYTGYTLITGPGSRTGKLFALDGNRGAVNWELPFNFDSNGASPIFPAIGSDGTIYIPSMNGLVAMSSTSKGLANSSWPIHGQNNQRTFGLNSAKPTIHITQTKPNFINISFKDLSEETYILQSSIDLHNWQSTPDIISRTEKVELAIEPTEEKTFYRLKLGD
jgi:outer membrane protein assembly factor BamB